MCQLLLIFQSVWAADNVYWTVKASGGVMATSSGAAALNISSDPGKYPNPKESVWLDCQNNWIYFNKDENGNTFDDVYVDRMMAIALAAQKTQTSIRVSIKRDENGYCHTNQIYDLGRNVYDK
jgi:hypothetical protein